MTPVSTQSQSTIPPVSVEAKLLEQGANLSEWRRKYPNENLLTKALFLGTSEHVITVLKFNNSNVNTVYASAYDKIPLISRLIQRIADSPKDQNYLEAFELFATSPDMDKELLQESFKAKKGLLNEDLFWELEKHVFLREDDLFFPMDP